MAATRPALSIPAPRLTPGEWHALRQAVHAVESAPCAGRGAKARLTRFLGAWRRDAADPVGAELAPLRDYLCAGARNDRATDALRDRLVAQGYSAAQIEALSLIAG